MWDDVQSWKFLKVEAYLYSRDDSEEIPRSEEMKDFMDQRNKDFLSKLILKVKEAGELIDVRDQYRNSVSNKWPRLPAKIWFEQAKEIVPDRHMIELTFEYYGWNGKYMPENGEFLHTESKFEATYQKE